MFPTPTAALQRCLETGAALKHSPVPHSCVVQMEAAREYFLEPSATPRPNTCPSTPAAGGGGMGSGSSTTAAAAGGAPGSGQLQAALQAQQQTTPDAAGAVAADGTSGRGGQRLPGSTSARGNLMLKLGAEGGSDSDGCSGSTPLAAPSAGLVPRSSSSQPVPISRTPAPAGGGPSAPPSDRQSFDSYESDLGSPWYYGSSPAASPAVCGFLEGAAAGAAGAAALPGGGGSLGRRSWEEVAAGRTSAAAAAAAGGPQRPIVHVGSAPSPLSLAGGYRVLPWPRPACMPACRLIFAAQHRSFSPLPAHLPCRLPVVA